MTEFNSASLTQTYREFDARCARQSYRLHNSREYEMSLFVPTEEAKKDEEEVLKGLLDEAKNLPAPDPVFAIIKSHMIDFIEGQGSALQSCFEHPSGFIRSLSHLVKYMGGKDSREPGERSKIVVNRLSQIDNLWSGVRTLLPDTPLAKLKDVKSACDLVVKTATEAKRELASQYKGLSEQDLDAIARSYDMLSAKASDWSKETGNLIEQRPKESLPAEKAVLDTDPDRYRIILDKELGVSLDELLSWYQDEVEKTRAEMIEAAAKVCPPGMGPVKTPLDAVNVMNTCAGPADSPEEMFERLRGYLKRAQAAAREWVRLPEESCVVIPVPDEYRLTYPWGGYGGGCPRRRPLVGEVFLNDTNYKNISDGWIKINAVHECYPGHHVQWVRGTLDPIPETLKLGAKRVPLQEGMCHRTERLMEYIYPEDPFYPLAVAFRRHHTSLRIMADLWLHYFHKPEEEAIKLYMDELGFDRITALGQVKSQETQNRIGYFTCYYYGMKKLEDLEKKYGYDKKTFTEYLFSVLNTSIQNFEAFLNLSEEDKNRFLTGFPSMLQFD
ncbi:MAG: DUF885 family protein [Bacillota bacterium]|jgi:hypothetical protein